MISNGSDLELFIHNICQNLDAGNTIKKEFVNICESCGYRKYTRNNCFRCLATDKTLNDYIHMFLTLPINCSNNSMHFVKQKGAFMFLQDFKDKFYAYMRLEYPNVKYRWVSDYSTFYQLGYSVVRINICKLCNNIAKANCCSNYCVSKRFKKYVIKDISCKLYS